MKTLIVHRNQSVADTSKEMLVQKLGYLEHDIVTTTSPEEAQSRLKDLDFTLVLCGAKFSGYDYTEIIAEINSTENRQRFILIAYTGGGQMKKCLSAGADGFIALPAMTDIAEEIGQEVLKISKSKSAYHGGLAQRFNAFAFDTKANL